MSSFKVSVERIKSIEPHPNADRLDIAQVLGWHVIVQKGAFQEGDMIVYFPIDSILPEELEAKIFGPNSKIKLEKSRVKTIKLRGCISQGLAVDPFEIGITSPGWEGQDVTKLLGITKWEPPVAPFQASNRAAKPKKANPNFHKYTDIENSKNYPGVFKEGEEVWVTEKIHGTNFRAGYVRTEADTFWKKIKRFFGRLPEYEFVYGSRNVQYQNKLFYSGYYDKNVYAEAVEKYHLRDILRPGEVIYGEIYGDGIQKGYIYGCKKGEHKCVFFDLEVNRKYIDTVAFRAMKFSGLPQAPEIYYGPYSEEKMQELKKGPSVLCPDQPIREGIVVKPVKERWDPKLGRVVLKYVNEDYLLKENTDYH